MIVMGTANLFRVVRHDVIRPPTEQHMKEAASHSNVQRHDPAIQTLQHQQIGNCDPSPTMATADTVDLGPPHEPKEESINVFNEIQHDLKKYLIHTRHQHDSEPSQENPNYQNHHYLHVCIEHEPEYFQAVR
jgi:hypothetical protein